MKGFVTQLVVKPAISGAVMGTGAVIGSLVISKVVFVDAAAWQVLLSAALCGVVSSPYATARSTVSGVRRILIRDRRLVQAIPNVLLSQDHFTLQEAEEISRFVHEFIERPPFLPHNVWMVRFAWRMVLSQFVNVDILRDTPRVLMQEMEKAKKKGASSFNSKALTEAVVLSQADASFATMMSAMDKKFAALLLVLGFVLPFAPQLKEKASSSKQ